MLAVGSDQRCYRLLGHANVALPAAIYAVYPVALVAMALGDAPDPPALTWRRRVALAALFLGGVACVAGMIYLAFNLVENPTVVGFQPRYLMPFAPLLLVALPSLSWRIPTRIAAWSVAAVATVSLASAVFAVCSAFYSASDG